MTRLIHELALDQAALNPAAAALKYKSESWTYDQLGAAIRAFGDALLALGLERQERVGIFLPKQFETVVGMLGAARAGCVFVPINPLLKPPQVEHILNDCNVRVLVTAPERYATLQDTLS